jgi:hypothetical protein
VDTLKGVGDAVFERTDGLGRTTRWRVSVEGGGSIVTKVSVFPPAPTSWVNAFRRNLGL